jgi:Zn-dependent protease with chaperone function
MAWGPRGSGFANACVLGPLAPFRYILVSPGLTDFLSLEECEAVMAHEIGHARHGHLWLLIGLLVSMAALCDLALRGLNALGLGDPFLSSAVFLVLVALYLRFLFGAVMRRCEAQADLAAAELMGSPAPVISALEKIGEMSGGTRNVYSWHHGSIARRVERLAHEGGSAEAIQACHARQRKLRRGLLAFTAAAVAALLGLALSETPGPDRMGGAPAAVEAPAGVARP